MISERDHALRPLMAVGSPILKDARKLTLFFRRWRVEGAGASNSLHSGSRTNSWIM